jgi:hypothetical protein
MAGRRFLIVVYVVALCALGTVAQAQHRGNRTNAAGNSTGPPVNEDLKQFDLAVVLQASPEQAKQFSDWANDTDSARKHAEVLTQANTAEAASQTLAFTDVLDDLQTDHDRFFGGFTAPQKAGLKELVKKAAKTNGEITRESKNLKAAGSNPQRVSTLAGKIAKALSELQTEQGDLASQMGIQRDSSSLH